MTNWCLAALLHFTKSLWDLAAHIRELSHLSQLLLETSSQMILDPVRLTISVNHFIALGRGAHQQRLHTTGMRVKLYEACSTRL